MVLLVIGLILFKIYLSFVLFKAHYRTLVEIVFLKYFLVLLLVLLFIWV